MRGRKLDQAGKRLAWLVIALSAQPAAAAITRQPYLQSLGPTSVVIMWQTDAAPSTASQVHYGTLLADRSLAATGSATQSASTPTPWNHAVVLSGLSPATRYYYDVGTLDGIEAGGTSDMYFETAPLPSDTRPFSFWVVGDSGTNGSDQHMVRDAMLSATAANPPDLMLQVGDMAYDAGSNVNFTEELFGVYTATLRHTPFWPAIGNHEGSEHDTSDSPTQSGPYYEAFALPSAGQLGGVASGTEAYYSFDYGSVHFIALDSDDSSTDAGSPQLTWLAADLAALSATRQWVIAWFHHPPYTKGTHNSDSAADSGARMVRMRENVLPILEAGGVDLVLAGHSHGYERSRLIRGVYGFGSSPNYATPNLATLTTADKILDAGDGKLSGNGAYEKPAGVQANSGTVYVVSGHGGNTLGGNFGHPVMRFAERRFGSCIVTVNHAQLSLRNIRSDGSVADFFSIVKPCSVGSDCDDEDPCTADACDVAGGCAHSAACDDHDMCTTDSCGAGGACGHVAIDCDDDNPCTDDSCSALSGCASVDNAADCDDGLKCTALDHCADGECASNAVDCSGSDDECNVGECAAATGACVAMPVADTTVCSLGHCHAGACQADPGGDAGEVVPDAGHDAGGKDEPNQSAEDPDDDMAMDASSTSSDAAPGGHARDAATSDRDARAHTSDPDASSHASDGGGARRDAHADDTDDAAHAGDCGCRIEQRRSQRQPPLAFVALLLTLIARRRRRR